MSNRNKFIVNQMKLSGGDSLVHQTTALVKTFPVEKGEEIMEKLNLKASSMTAETVIAMKVDIGLSWSKLFKMSR